MDPLQIITLLSSLIRPGWMPIILIAFQSERSLIRKPISPKKIPVVQTPISPKAHWSSHRHCFSPSSYLSSSFSIYSSSVTFLLLFLIIIFLFIHFCILSSYCPYSISSLILFFSSFFLFILLLLSCFSFSFIPPYFHNQSTIQPANILPNNIGLSITFFYILHSSIHFIHCCFFPFSSNFISFTLHACSSLSPCSFMKDI